MRIERIIFGLSLLLAAAAPVYAFGGTSGPSPIPPPPNFQITTTSVTLCKGVTNIIPINVTNFGNAADYPTMQSVQLFLNNKDLIQTGNTLVINSIAPDNSAIINAPVYVDLNASSLITVQVPISYDYLTLYQDSETRNITFDVVSCPSEFPLNVSVTPTVLVSGEMNNLTFGFTNTGNVTLRNISAHTSISGSLLGVQFINHRPIEIGSIAPHSTVNVTQEMYENNSQIFTLNVSVSYFAGRYGLEQELDGFSMLSGGTIDMIPSSITVSPSTVSPGGIFSLSFIVTDTGTAGVSNMNATAALPKGFRHYGVSNSTYIGSMGTETPTPVSLTLEANSSVRAGTYTIPVKVSYLGNFRQRSSFTVDVPVYVGGTSSGGTLGQGGNGNNSGSGSGNAALYIAAGAFIVAIAAIFYLPRVMRGKRHTNPKQ